MRLVWPPCPSVPFRGGPVLLELGQRGGRLWRQKTWINSGTGAGGWGVIYKRKVVDVSQKEIPSH